MSFRLLYSNSFGLMSPVAKLVEVEKVMKIREDSNEFQRLQSFAL